MDENRVVFEIEKDVLASAEFSKNQLEADLQYLSKVLGEDMMNLTSKNLNNLAGMQRLHYVAESLRFFEGNDSLDRFLERFNTPQEAASHLPTLFFGHHLLGEEDGVRFEPDTGDIHFEWEDESVIFEFKRPRESEEVQKHRRRNMDALEDVSEVVDDRFQYDIRYQNPEDLTNLPELLERKLPEINASGETMLSETVKLRTTEKDDAGYPEDVPEMTLAMHSSVKDTDKGEWRPAVIQMGVDGSVSIAGPTMDERDKLENLIDRARKQLEKNHPAIVVIEIGSIMGAISDLKRRIQRLFQSQKNTRLNAVVLFSYQFGIEEGGVKATMRTIRNPYCANKLPDKFYNILRDRDQERVSPPV